MFNASLRTLLFGLVASISVAGQARAAVVVADDFSTDSGRWTYVGTATRDPNGFVTLTDAAQFSMGQIWLDTGTDRPFRATFKYLSGGNPVDPGDGLVLMFYKDVNYAPELGGWLGFSSGYSPAPGYGVELDSFANTDWAEEAAHVALIEGAATQQLEYALDARVGDGQWHDVEAIVEKSRVTVSIDGAVAFSWSGTLDRSFTGIGFSAATCVAWASHVIDDVVIEDFIVRDDFSADSGRWSYVGTATREPAGYVSLTNAVPSSLGQLWLDTGIDRPFKATFNYLAGGSPDALADGLVLMFYKDANYVPDMGGWLGFSEYPYEGPSYVPGYGVEVDDFLNEWDPDPSHVGLIEANASNHLAYALDARASDGQWHQIEAIVDAAGVTVSIDGAVAFTWSGTLDRTFSGLGFSGATAAAWTNHFIDDVVIQETSLPVDFTVANPVSANAGVLSATILGSAKIDVSKLDLASLRLHGLSVRDPSKSGSLGDVNLDGYPDLTLHFEKRVQRLPVGEFRAQLYGRLVTGAPIFGFGTLIVVP